MSVIPDRGQEVDEGMGKVGGPEIEDGVGRKKNCGCPHMGLALVLWGGRGGGRHLPGRRGRQGEAAVEQVRSGGHLSGSRHLAA
jgi:hypothetical protein